MPSAPPVFRPSGYRTPAQRKRAYDKTHDHYRGSAHSRGYGSTWRRARAAYLNEHPLCIECESNKVLAPATEVDHIIPHRGDMVLFWDETNWQPLCKPHHSAKTMREVQERGREQSE
jgi:5-methylcytosine-specific restriction protein A